MAIMFSLVKEVFQEVQKELPGGIMQKSRVGKTKVFCFW